MEGVPSIQRDWNTTIISSMDSFSMDKETQRTLDFHNGWFIDPLFFGDYPSSTKKNVGSRLPNFTKEQSKKLKGSFDFVGLNHYGTSYVSDSSSQWIAVERDYMRDSSSKQTVMRDERCPYC
ncbi:beta-glucosidase 22 isoform X1 [Cryptomeria japonica]|uniref:beta-glucosidase 22 isoform X1 n=1 Tax=Cryptomeria japonica TaxID=3369 RepID=UPI0025ABB2BF|nr:beta-glucosidase 22 isoform X1 [Cryptomeria japonica]